MQRTSRGPSHRTRGAGGAASRHADGAGPSPLGDLRSCPSAVCLQPGHESGSLSFSGDVRATSSAVSSPHPTQLPDRHAWFGPPTGCSGGIAHTLLDGRQRGQASSETVELGRRDHARELGIDRFNTGPHRGGCRATSLRQSDEHPSAILGIDLTNEIAPQDERVDELTRGLLADTQPMDHVGCCATAVRHAPEDERPVARQIIEPGRNNARRYGPGVAPPGGSQQRRDREIVLRGSCHSEHDIALNLDSQELGLS